MEGNLGKDKVDFTIKRVCFEDLSAIKKIEMQNGLSPWSLEDYEKELNRKDSVFLKAELNQPKKESGLVVGFTIVRLITIGNTQNMNTLAELYNIAVNRKYRENGIGKQMLIKVINSLKINEMHLEVRQSNHTAIEFYKKFGFKKIGIRKNFYSKPKENALLMVFKKTWEQNT